MKLTSVDIRPGDLSDPVTLSFRDPRRINPYNVKTIIGLDADEIVPRFYGGSGQSKFQNLGLNKREIVLRIELNPRFGEDETYSDLRDALYRVIASSRNGLLHLRFKNGSTVICGISGVVKKLEAPLFNKNPEVQITMNCDEEPMLKALNRVIVETDVTGLNALLDGPTAPTGFRLEIGINGDRGAFVITDPGDDSWEFRVEYDFLDNDILHFSSEFNNKYLYVERPGDPDPEIIHIADLLTLESIWPILFPGENAFHLNSPAGLVLVDMSYFPTYWGV